MNNFITITLCCAIFYLTYGVPVNQTVIFEMDANNGSEWLDGANGLYCGPPENINNRYAGCQGTKNSSYRLVYEQHDAGAMPGAEFGLLSPYSKVLAWGGFTILKYIKVEYTFANGDGISRLVYGGVGNRSAYVQILSKECSAYEYNIQFYDMKH